MRLEGDDLRQSEEIGAAVRAAIVGRDVPEGSVLVRYVVVADFMEPDGERAIVRTATDGAAKWELCGMLGEAMEDWE